MLMLWLTSAVQIVIFVKIKGNFNLNKATKPFERVNLDFKEPLLSTSESKYMLVIIDEYSRFSFVYACKNLKASTIIEKLTNLFCIFFFFFFFYLYIYPPDSQESNGGAIHRVRNYPDLLPEMPRYCCPLVI